MPKERQVSFSAGELSPTLWGRTDLPQYQAGARVLLNFLVTPHGVITNRTGTQHVATLPERYYGAGLALFENRGRLVPFIVDSGDAQLLVFDGLRVRVLDVDTDDPRHQFGDLVDVAGAQIYAAADLTGIRWAQAAKLLTLVHEGYDPREIERDSDGNFAMSTLSFDVPAFPVLIGSNLSDTRPGLYQENPFGGAISSGHVVRPWSYQVTRLIRRQDGTLYESAPYTLEKEITGTDGTGYTVAGDLPASLAVYPDWVQTVFLWVGEGAQVEADDTEHLEAHRIYRGREGRYGYLGQTKGDRFTDDGSDPNFSDPPPQGTNPFIIYTGADGSTVLRREKPTQVAYFEGRRHFAATAERPTRDWGSALGDDLNFDEVIPADDTDSLSFDVKSTRIRGLIGAVKLLVFTATKVIAAGGSGQDEVMTPNSIAMRDIVHHGCSSALGPLAVGDTVFYPSQEGVAPRAIRLSGGSVTDEDVSLLSRHLFEGYTMVDWAFARRPYPVLYIARSDGLLLSLTYVPEQQILAWARQEVAGDGVVESVAVRQEPLEDGVYLSVKRDGVRHVERFAYKVLPLRGDGHPDVRYSIYLDRAVSYHGASGVTGTAQFYILASDGSFANLLMYDAGGALDTSDHSGLVIQIDDPSGGEPFRLQVTNDMGTGEVQGTVLSTWLDETARTEAFFWDSDADALSSEKWSYLLCRNSLSGLAHLEGETVTALVDGNVIEDLVVTGGAVALPEGTYAAIAHVGLPYNSDFESLDAVNDRTRQKIVKKTWVELEASRGGSVGPSFDNLTEIRNREVSDGYLALDVKRFEAPVPVAGKWDTAGRVCLRQSAPLPCTVLGLTREVEYGG